MIRTAVAAAATMLIALATASGAHAVVYQDPTIAVDVTDTTPVEGTEFTVSASSTANCGWAISFNGSVEGGSGNATSATFTAPAVDERTDYPAVVRCTFDDTVPLSGPADSASTLVTPAALQTATRTVNITVLPLGDDGSGAGSGAGGSSGENASSGLSGILPDTGGIDAEIVLAGGVLLLVGVGVVVAVRRRGTRT